MICPTPTSAPIIRQFYFALFLILSLLACEKKGIDTGEPQFNIDLFETYIVDSMEAAAVGYAYSINENGMFYSKGTGGFADQTSQIEFTTDLRIQVGSISKTITAAALLRILHGMADVNIDSPVSPYLPDHWTLGPNVENLTFKDLLSHKSAFYINGGNNTYKQLQMMVESGLNESERGKDAFQKYFNHNYALFRIIMPILVGKAPTTVTDLDELGLAWSYLEIIHEQLFNLMDIDQAYCRQLSNVRIKYYNCTFGNENNGSDHTLNCGAYGWNLSAPELAAFMAHLRHNDNILNSDTRQLMDDLALGWENEIKSLVGDHGTYLFHGGQYHYGDSTAGGLKTIVIKYPNRDIEAALVMNCVDHANSKIARPRLLMRAAYDQAWE